MTYAEDRSGNGTHSQATTRPCWIHREQGSPVKLALHLTLRS